MPLTHATAPIAFALDYASLDEAAVAAREVSPAVGMVKVGLELFVRHGAAAVALGTDVGLPVFLDLKLHDIPETVGRAVAQVAALGARVVTVHASGGRAMLRRAVESARRADPRRPLDVCAVTVLTSLDEGDLQALDFGGASPEGARTGDLALRLARLAWDEGVRWFVCSPLEVRRLRDALGPEAVLVTPGIRSARPATAGDDHGDQKRVATPEVAVRDGASWLVVGRPIRDAEDKLEAARAIARAIANASTTSAWSPAYAAPEEKER